jgi:predicted HTH transcriptional regulator
MGWVNLPPGVIIERTPENIEDIIRRGESREVEFKASLPKNWDDFAETIVAMSNGGGGVVFVGVDDNGVIMGCEDPKIADSINDNLRSVCDPPIEPEISREPLQGKTVVIVRIAEGKRKPYVLKGKGVYVRIGATDRIATRDETLSLTGPDTSQFGRAPWNS